MARTIARYGSVDLLCIDELGCMELDRRGGGWIVSGADGGRDGWAEFQAFRDRAFGQGAATQNVER